MSYKYRYRIELIKQKSRAAVEEKQQQKTTTKKIKSEIITKQTGVSNGTKSNDCKSNV
jgi:hypothetical protein